MRVSELMTEKVLTIGPEAPIKDVAKILVDNGISGLPVCDIEGGVLGVVSEGDILYKEHDPTEGHHGRTARLDHRWGARLRRLRQDDGADRRKAMTSPAITIAPFESVAEAARIMCERHVNRLPVVKGDQLVGIVTRADLVRAFTRSDAELQREIEKDIFERVMWIDAGRVEVTVQDGKAALSGQARYPERCRPAQQAGRSRCRSGGGRVERDLEPRRHHAQGEALAGAVRIR